MEALRELSRNHTLGNPIRLGVMLYLLPRERVLFKELLEVLEVTPGNLDSHLKALEKAGYIETYKVFADRPRTAVRITEKGAKETARYLRTLRAALEGV
ncbi:transcriptional regulator [Thermococcus thioreducens]|uniref:Transcriptional regulator n=1 Tax=Thermococcus thioreducens TaxID=277988 RepID=A0A0Q2XQ86_9EURY|nr:transcriptional regulator [Thermococcus thioreducens]ASJ11433.1 transcriptional regulator [Thermococcus thioreducens]KQH83452.1 ArsR family transcriptional regulator [Thermococcus thioreducens]SEW06775.1 transcriptional regulator, ArsR family [Thermococcus thioreducens]